MTEPDLRPPQEPVSPRAFPQVRRNLLRRRTGPVQRLSLFASGADKTILQEVPTEKLYLSVIGTAVLLTTAVAALSAGIAAGVLLYGTLAWSGAVLLAAVFWGVAIFIFDRCLVKAPLNPTPLESDAGDGIHPVPEERRSRAGEVLGVLLRATPRFALALASSYFFAEVLLFGLIYREEVETRVHSIAAAQAQQMIVDENATYDTRVTSHKTALAEYLGQNDPVLKDLTAQLTTAQTDLRNKLTDAAAYAQLAANECDGYRATVTLHDGRTLSTSGIAGNGDLCRTDRQQAALAASAADGARTTAATLSSSVATRQARFLQNNDTSVEAENASFAGDTQSHNRKIGQLQDQAREQDIPGIAIRIQAMHDLELATQPTTLTPTPPPTCGVGPSGLPCNVWRFFVQPTPVGPSVGATRLTLLAIELLPIILKISFSLRRTRPYESLVTTLEAIEENRNQDMVRVNVRPSAQGRTPTRIRAAPVRYHDNAATEERVPHPHTDDRPSSDVGSRPSPDVADERLARLDGHPPS
jgi:hypothetical protein